MILRLLLCAVTFSFSPSLCFANPSFDCSKAQGPVELTICEKKNLALGALDTTLHVLYQQGLKVVDNPEALKKEQLNWLKKRPSEGPHLDTQLEDAYENRIKDLLRNPSILSALADEIFKTRKAVNPYLLSYITLVLLEKNYTLNDFYDLPDNFRLTELLTLSPTKGVVCLGISEGAYVQTYGLFKLIKNDNQWHVSPLALPVGKNVDPLEELSLSEKDVTNMLQGDIAVDPKKKILTYTERLASYEIGALYQWQFLDDDSVLWLGK